jgi:ABC-type glycerol-3-phosphate transport system permease component
MLVTSPISGDYRLLSLFIPLAFFVNEPQESKYDLLYVVLFGLMMIPKSYYIIPFMNQLAGLGLSLGVVVNPLLLFAMAFMIISEGFLKQKLIS